MVLQSCMLACLHKGVVRGSVVCSGYASVRAGNFFPWLDNLQPVFYDHFVLYLTEVVRWYRDTHGITFRCAGVAGATPRVTEPCSVRHFLVHAYLCMVTRSFSLMKADAL